MTTPPRSEERPAVAPPRRRGACLPRIFATVAVATVALIAFFGAAVVIQPGRYLTMYFNNLRHRAVRNQETWPEVAGLQVMYGGMVVVGGVFYPEASQVLYEFCWGGGDYAVVDPSYIRNSPMIRSRLKKLKPGQHWPPGGGYGHFKQTEDVRLSYAFNPLAIDKKRDGTVVVTSPVKVAKLTEDVYTRFYLGPFTFDLPDSLMRVACRKTDYVARSEWRE
jgi:hypothetical protein